MFDSLELYIRIIKKYGTLSDFASAVHCTASFVKAYIDGDAVLDTTTMNIWIDALEISDSEIDSLFFNQRKTEQETGDQFMKPVFDNSRLKADIYDQFESLKDFADSLNEPLPAVYDKLNNKSQFTLDDIEKWSSVLQLNADQINDHFFNYHLERDSVGRRIKAYMDATEADQNSIAKTAGLTPSQLSDICSDKCPIDCIIYHKICTALNVPLDSFLTEGGR